VIISIIKMNNSKETYKQRKERIKLSGTLTTKVIPDKTKYNRKKGKKHELKLDNKNGLK